MFVFVFLRLDQSLGKITLFQTGSGNESLHCSLSHRITGTGHGSNPALLLALLPLKTKPETEAPTLWDPDSPGWRTRWDLPPEQR